MSTVARPERMRLLEALLEELVEKGYPALEVEAAVQRAHLDGGRWSGRFPDKDACLLEAFQELTRQMKAAIGRGCGGAENVPERIAGGLRALLAELAGRAPLAEALARAFPAIGPAAVGCYQGFVESLAPLLTPARDLADGVELPTEVEMLAVGAAEALVMERIQSGETTKLPALGPEVLFSVLVPFVGPEAASAAMDAERAAISGPAELPNRQ